MPAKGQFVIASSGVPSRRTANDPSDEQTVKHTGNAGVKNQYQDNRRSGRDQRKENTRDSVVPGQQLRAELVL